MSNPPDSKQVARMTLEADQAAKEAVAQAERDLERVKANLQAIVKADVSKFLDRQEVLDHLAEMQGLVTELEAKFTD